MLSDGKKLYNLWKRKREFPIDDGLAVDYIAYYLQQEDLKKNGYCKCYVMDEELKPVPERPEPFPKPGE